MLIWMYQLKSYRPSRFIFLCKIESSIPVKQFRTSNQIQDERPEWNSFLFFVNFRPRAVLIEISNSYPWIPRIGAFFGYDLHVGFPNSSHGSLNGSLWASTISISISPSTQATMQMARNPATGTTTCIICHVLFAPCYILIFIS